MNMRKFTATVLKACATEGNYLEQISKCFSKLANVYLAAIFFVFCIFLDVKCLGGKSYWSVLHSVQREIMTRHLPHRDQQLR